MKKMNIITVVMVMVFSAALAFAGPGGRGMGPGPGMSPYAASNLELTPEQSQKLQALEEAYLKEITPLQNQLFSKKAEMRLLWSQQNYDQEKTTVKQKEINELQQQTQERATQYQFETRNIFTPEQRAKAVNFAPGHSRGPGWKMVGLEGEVVEEPYQVLFEEDYEGGYPQWRYDRRIPCKCPFCEVLSHHVVQRRTARALVTCPLCDKIFDAKKYQSRAVRRSLICLRNYTCRISIGAIP